MNETTYWSYTFWWQGAHCEAKDGFIFVNGCRVQELADVNQSSQTADRFFVDGKDVTEILLSYLSRSSTPAAPSLTMSEGRKIKALFSRFFKKRNDSAAVGH